jgi:hypothetical protein
MLEADRLVQGHSSFLQRLFEIRKYFRLVSHQEQGSDPHSTALTCVDVVLAKMSLLAMPLAVGPAIYDSDRVEGAEWIQLRRDNDVIRAATQLPGKHDIFLFYDWLMSCPFLFRQTAGWLLIHSFLRIMFLRLHDV